MPVIQDAIIGGIAWEAFSKSVAFYNEEINDFVLRIYIAQQLRALEGVSDEKIDETAEIIEATILDTPENIKKIENHQEQKEAFEKYFKKTIKESLIDIEDSEIEIDLGDGTLEGSVKHIKNSTIKIK
jgi:hypothetical protein